MLLTQIQENRALEIHLSDHCNLNCIGCSHFSPLAPKKHLDNNELIVSLSSINKDVRDYFTQIRLIGGEPLLNPDIVNIIRTTRKYFETSEILIVTNGILIPRMPDSFWEECKKSRVNINITIYPKINYDEVFKSANSHNTAIGIYADRSDELRFEHRPLSLNGEQNELENFQACRFVQQWSCLQLVGTRLFICPTSAYIGFFSKKYHLDISCDEYIDLSEKVSPEDIVTFVSHPKIMCKYCNLDGINPVTWELSHSRIEEWI